MSAESTKIIDSIKEYWESDHWKRFVHLELEKDGERIHHIHHSIDTSLHPESLMVLLQSYYAKQGWVIDREVDLFVLAPKPMATHHGVCAKDLPHVDFNFRFRPDVVIAPMASDGAKDNCEAWSASYMENFYSQFKFRPVGTNEEAEVEAWFHSEHWQEACRYVEDPKVVHVHVNTLSSVHPNAIIAGALRAIKREGWTLWDYQPCVYDVHGAETGKIVFMLSYPQQIFDIAWQYDPNVVLARSPRPFNREGYPGFDIRTQDDVPAFIAKHNWTRLPRQVLREAIP